LVRLTLWVVKGIQPYLYARKAKKNLVLQKPNLFLSFIR